MDDSLYPDPIRELALNTAAGLKPITADYLIEDAKKIEAYLRLSVPTPTTTTT